MILMRRLLVRNFSMIKERQRFKVHQKESTNFENLNSKNVQWENVRSSLLTTDRSVTKNNLDGMIVGACIRQKRDDLLKSYFGFMKSNELTISDFSIGTYLKHRWNEDYKKLLSINDEKHIIELCEYLEQKHSKILHPNIAETIVFGYCLTEKWQKCFDIIRKADYSFVQFSPSIYLPLIIRAMQENDLKTVWELIDSVTERNFIPNFTVIVEFFRKFVNNKTELEKMLTLLGDFNAVIPDSLLEEINGILRKSHTTKIVRISSDGRCSHCRSSLESSPLNSEEFEILSEEFLRNVLIKNDVFLRTTPKELQKFTLFVDKTKPYDCVIDGLNVAYASGPSNPKFLAGNLVTVVQHFKKRNKKIFVVGRQHMRHWPEQEMSYVQKNSVFFLAEDISKDDPFLLYAALSSGPKTDIFSRDLMRAHSHLLSKESRKLFRRWQQQHQIMLRTFRSRTRIDVEEPIKFDVKAHKTGDHWHIPFTSENQTFSYNIFGLPTNWICLKFKK